MAKGVRRSPRGRGAGRPRKSAGKDRRKSPPKRKEDSDAREEQEAQPYSYQKTFKLEPKGTA